MNAIVVYESFWGNTAAVAKAIAEGIGPQARAMPTSEATAEVVGAADLIVAGAPVLGFSLSTNSMRKNLGTQVQAKAPSPPDLSHAPMRGWLDELPRTSAQCSAFETRLRFSPGGATGTIERKLEHAGCRELARAERFYVTGTYGPTREGEIERARAWGATLAEKLAAVLAHSQA
jgi:hypothetical protein